ncbi:hypothetical protein CRG98_002628 [Punica granatum]|uniref:Uncharacterized protein n=1 Tax=Punica granatum TaxID=22663 RepID=A0A2I0L8U7_PUNGR|nr:hypothetical protein CRG98_002628 [Punica granatum]
MAGSISVMLQMKQHGTATEAVPVLFPTSYLNDGHGGRFNAESMTGAGSRRGEFLGNKGFTLGNRTQYKHCSRTNGGYGIGPGPGCCRAGMNGYLGLRGHRGHSKGNSLRET